MPTATLAPLSRQSTLTRPPAQLALVLHAHLPYVLQPERERALEENWLHEAMADCYLPLLAVMAAAEGRGGRLRLTLSLSPTLLAMLADPGLPGRFLDYLERRRRLCAAELRRHADPGRQALLRWYQGQIEARHVQYCADLGGDLIAAWVHLRDAGRVELITTAATHGFAPLLRDQPGAVRAQLRVGRDAFQAMTGLSPQGLWLPECGYFPGLEREIAAAGYAYSVLETHGLEQGHPTPAWGVQAPVDGGGVAFFGRDPLSAAEVWGPTIGYPGHPDYREYYADLGFEAPGGGLADFLPPGAGPAPTGLKFHRVTGGAGPKALYDPARAARRAARDARRFVRRRQAGAAAFAGHFSASPTFAPSSVRPALARPPLTVAPYDAELFGHWWFEGPLFLAALDRELDACPDLEAVTLGQHLERHGCAAACRVAASTWGEAGYNGTWLRPETAWVHLQLRQAAEEFQDLRRRYGRRPAASPAGRFLRQAARSLLLAQGSDWTFHLGRGGSDYAERHLRAQLARFACLADALGRCGDGGEGRDGGGDLTVLETLERLDALFPELNPDHFAMEQGLSL